MNKKELPHLTPLRKVVSDQGAPPARSRITTSLRHFWSYSLLLTLGLLLQANLASAQMGKAIELNGSTDYIQVPAGNYFGGGNFTIEGWVYPRVLNNCARLMDFGSGQANNNVFFTYNCGGGIRFVVHNGSSEIFNLLTPSSSIPTAGQWYHYAATVSGNLASIYVNGQLVTSTTFSGTIPNISLSNCYIGKSNWSGDALHNGKIDEFRIWNVARTQEQIQDNMNRTLTGTETGLQVYYDMESIPAFGQAQTITDLAATTGGAQNGTIFGTATSPGQSVLSNNWGNALHFDGINDYVASISSSPFTGLISNSMTVQAWVRPDNTTNTRMFVQASSGFEASVTAGGGLLVSISINGGWQNYTIPASSVGFAANKWSHFAATYNGSQVFIYVDGKQVSTANVTGNIGITNDPLNIGRHLSVGSYFPGCIDEVSVWNTALSAAQIQAGMFSPISTSAAGLLAYYPFNQGNANSSNAGLTTLTDAKGGLNGTLNNFALSGNTSNWVSRVPVITSPTQGTITGTTAILGANHSVFISDLEEKGIVFSTTANPSLTNGRKAISSGNATGAYTVAATNLKGGTKYYYRGYAYSGTSVGYSTIDSFTTSYSDFGNALAFDGVNDHFYIGSNGTNTPPPAVFSGLNALTLEVWIKPRTLDATQRFLNRQDQYGYNWALEIDGTGKTLNFWVNTTATGKSIAVPSSMLSVNQWTHIAGVYNGSQMILYINGIAVGTTAQSGTILSNSLYLGIGTVGNVGGYYNGEMDELRIWNVARTQAQIQANMGGGIAPTTSGLIAYFPFNQGVPNAANPTITPPAEMTNNHFIMMGGTLALSGNTSNWVTHTANFANNTVTNNALDFDGVNDYVDLGNAAPINNLTSVMSVEAWVRPTSYGPTSLSYVIGNENTSSGWYIRFHNTNSVIQFGTSVNVLSVSNTLAPLNKWTHLAGVLQGGILKFYVNGALVASANFSNFVIPNGNVYIGECSHPNGSNRRFTGSIDEIRIWNVARTQTQIQGNMYASLPPSNVGLIAYYNFNQGTAGGANTSVTTLTDASASNISGTLTNFALTGATSNWVTSTSPMYDNNPIISNIQAGQATFTSTSAYVQTGSILEQGFIYNTGNATPTFATSSRVISNSTTLGAFSASPTGLLENQLYSVRGYITTASGTMLSNNTTTFTTTLCRIVATDIVINAMPTTASATWTTNTTGATAYSWKVVDAGAGVNGTAVSSGTSTTATANITNLVPGNNYEFYVLVTGGCSTTTWSSARTFSTQVEWNNALNFDGGDDYVSLANGTAWNAMTNAITLEMWVRPNNNIGSQLAFVREEPGTGLGLELTNGIPFFGINTGSWSSASATAPIPVNQWSHLAAVYNGSQMLLYVNGTLVATTSKTGSLTAMNTAARVGIDLSNARAFSGSIDEIRIWSTARTQSQIQAGMYNAIPTSSTGLLAYYPFDQGVANGTNSSVTTATDIKSGLTGTLTNFALTGNTSNWIARTPYLSSPTKTNIAATSATLGATVNQAGTATLTERGVLWATTAANLFLNGTGFTKLVAGGTSAGAFTVNATGLPLSSKVYYKGYAMSNDGYSYSALDSFFTECPVVAAPTVSNITSTTATLAWTAANNSTGYIWKVVASGAGSAGTAVATGTTTSALTANVTGLASGTTYDVYIQNNCGSGSLSDWSAVTSFSTLCDAPTALTASNVGYSTLTLSWGAGSTADYTWKVVASGAGENGTAIITGNATATSVNTSLGGLIPGTDYDAYVRTNCAASNSSWSSVASFTTLTCSSFPNNIVSYNVTYTTATFSWNLVPNVEGYNWKVVASGAGVNGTAIALGTSNTNTANTTVLSAGTNYDFYVQTLCVTGYTSPWSNALTFSTNTCNIPSAISLSNLGYTSATLNWAALSGIIDYSWKVVAAGAGVNGTAVLSGNSATSPVSLTGLNPATSYEVYIQTNCAAGVSSAWSNVVTFTTLTCAPPTNLAVSNIGFGGGTLTWSQASAANGFTYKVVNAGAGINGTAIATGTSNSNSVAITGLSAGSSYDAYVLANCGANISSNWSNAISFNTLNCNAPVNVTVAGTTFTSAVFKWTPIANASGYNWKVVAAGAGVNATAIVSGTTADSAIVAGLNAGTSYDFYVRTNCTASIFSNYSNGTSFATQTCVTPINVSVTNVTPGSAVVTWTAATVGAQYYWKVVPKGAGVNATAIKYDSTTTSSVAITGLDWLTAYDVYVSLNCGQNINSTWSIPATFVTPLMQNNGVWALGNSGWFNGVNDYATLGGGLTNPNDFSIELWAKADNVQPDTSLSWFSTATDGYLPLIERTGSGQTPYAIRYNPANGRIKVLRTDGTNAPTEIISNTSINNGAYHHIALTRYALANEMKLYIDGVLDVTATDLTTTINPASAVTYLAGSFVSSNNNYLHFKGNIDDVRFWNVVRTVGDIQNSKDAPLTGAEVGLIAYYNMENVISGNGQTIPSATSPANTAANALTTGTSTTPIFVHPCPTFNVGNFGIQATATTLKGRFNSNIIFPTGFDWKITTANAGVNNLGLFSGSATDSILISGLDAATNYDIYLKTPCTTLWEGPITVATQNTWRNTLSFDGTNDNISLGNGASFASIGANLTLEAWVNPSANTATQYIFNKETASATGGYSLYLDAGVPKFAVKSTTWATASGTESLPLDQWTHIAGVYNGSTLTLYVNGRIVGSAAKTGTIPAIAGNAFLGKQYTNTNYFAGRIDEARIWNTARSATEIQTNMFNFPATSATGLVAYYQLNEGTANSTNSGVITAVDATTNANNGTLSGFTFTGNTSNWIAHAPVLTSPITGALVGNNVTVYDSVLQAGTANVIERGFLWSITNTTASNLILGAANVNKVVVSGNAFSADLTNLPLGATISYRAYAFSNDGIGYSIVNQNITTFCPPPSAIGVSGVTTNSAVVNWSNANGGVNFSVKVVAAGAGSTGTAVGTVSMNNGNATVTGLSALTNYEVYVNTICTSTNSSWAGPVAFTTLCNPVNLPMTQNFTVAATTLPSCWTSADANSDTYTWGADATGKMQLSPNPTAQMNDWLFSGGLNLTAGVSYRITFTYGANSSNSYEKLALRWGNAADASAMGNNLLFTNNAFNSASTTYDLAFTPTTTGAYYLGWNGFSDGNSGGLFIDNVIVEVNPCGNAPTNLATSNITATGLTASWTGITGATNYTWKIVSSGAGANAVAVVTGNTANLTAAISGIFPGMSYDLFVKANCSSNISSAWVGPIAFNTPNQIGLFASAGNNDAYIDVNWSLPVSPCLLNAANQPYSQGIYTELVDLNNNQIVYQLPISDLSPYIGAQQPTFTQVANGNNTAYYQVPAASIDNFWASSLGQWTIETWIKFAPAISNANLWYAAQGSNTPFSVKLNGQVLSLNNTNFATPIPHSRWVHLALTYDGGNATLYVDGIAKETKNIGYFNAGNANYSYRLLQNTANGQVGEFRLWDRVRTAVEISNNRFLTAIPNSNVAGSDLFLHLRWNSANTVPTNAGAYSANALTYSSGAASTTAYVATPNYTPINGSFRHLVGPSQTRTYQLNVRQIGSGTPTVACSTYTALGSTLAFQPPVSVNATDNLLDKVTVTFTNKSKLGENFKIYRAGKLRAIIPGTTVIDSVVTYNDVYGEEDSLSLVNGTAYNYCVQTVNNTLNQSYAQVCNSGATFNLNFSATDNTFADKVNLSWANVSTFGYPVTVTRDGVALTTLAATATSYTDNAPLFGKIHKYGIALKDTLSMILASDFDNGSVPAKGQIKGRAITDEGGYALKNVRIILHSLVDSTRRDTAYTNFKGEYTFSNVYYGDFSGNFRLTAKYGNHIFFENPRIITLSDTAFVKSNIDFRDSIGLTVSTTPLNVSNFVATPNATQDRVQMAWSYTPTANDSTIFEIYREATLLAVLSNAPTTVSTYNDLTGIPQANYLYKLYAYKIQNGVVTKAEKTTTVAFPAITKPTNFVVAANNTLGIINLSWANTSTNIDGFNLYRNNAKIAELSNATLTYTDANVQPGSSNVYMVKARRKPSLITFESAPTTSNATLAPALPNLLTLTATASTARNSVNLAWTVPTTLTATYNFTGYNVYRKKGTSTVWEYVGQVFKGRPNSYEDKAGQPNTSYTYMVKTFFRMLNGTIVESAGLSKTVTYPVVSAPTALTVSNNTVIGEVVMSWTTAFTSAAKNIDGQVVYRGTDSVFLPANVSTYRFMVNEIPTSAFGVRTYREVGGKKYYSNQVTANAKPLSSGTNPVLATNFKASQDLPNHVRLVWDYPNYVSSTFKIYRDNVVIANLATSVRTYQDYSAVKGATHLYQIEATNGSNTSQKVGSWGRLKSILQLNGLVASATAKVGMPNVDITASSNGFYVHTRTDSAGYYKIDGLPALAGTVITVAAEGANCTFSPTSKTFTIGTAQVYNVNFNNTFAPPATDTLNPARPMSVNAFADYARRNITLTWNESNNTYDGVEVYRANTLLGTVNAGSNLVWYDTEGYPGIIYPYSLRSFVNTTSGKKYSEQVAKAAVFPIIEDVLYLTATPKPNENKLTLTWSHRWDNHTYYLVQRNDEPVKQLSAGTPLTYDDLTGEPGQQYTYTVTAVMTVNGVNYASNPVSVTATYPAIGEVLNFTAAVPSATVNNSCNVGYQRTRNHVLLTWVASTPNINGFRVYRDGNSIAELPKDSLFYRDYAGIPATQHVYTVKTILKRNEVNYNSDGVNATQIYPALSAPMALQTPKDTASLIRLRWAYPENAISGFYLYYNGSTGTNIPSDTLILSAEGVGEGIFSRDHGTGVPLANYQYAVRAYSIRDGVTYLSPAATFVCNGGNTVYPTVQAPTNLQATDGVYQHHVVITWAYPLGGNVAGIEIFKDNVLLGETTGGVHSFADYNANATTSYKARAYRILNGAKYYSAFSNANDGYPATTNVITSGIVGAMKFGRSLSGNGDIVGVGAPNINANSIGYASFLRFDANTRNWTTLLTTNRPSGAYGQGLSVWGNRAMVSAPYTNFVWALWDIASGSTANSYQNTYAGYSKGGWATAATNQNAYFSEIGAMANGYIQAGKVYAVANTQIGSGVQHKSWIGYSMETATDTSFVTTYHYGTSVIVNKNGTNWIFGWNKPANNPTNAKYGHAVAASNKTEVMVGAPDFTASNAGRAYIYAPNSTSLTNTFSCPDANSPNNRFGQSVDIEGNFAIVGAPGSNSGKGAAYLYYKGSSGWFYLKKYEYPTTTADSAGTDVVASNFVVIGAANANSGAGKLYWDDLRLGLLTNVAATDGTLNGKTKIAWDFYKNDGANVSGFRIYRDGALIQTASANDTYVFDETGVAGKHYAYEVSAFSPQVESITYLDEGWSKVNGYLDGAVLSASGGQTPIQGTSITAKAIVKGDAYTYNAVSDIDGKFAFPALYYSDTTVVYTLTAKYGNHVFVTNPITVTLSPQNPSKTGLSFFDNTAYTVSGLVYQKDVSTGLDSIRVLVKYEFANGSTNQREVYTDKSGKYNLVLEPGQYQLSKMTIEADSFRTLTTSAGADSLRYKFKWSGTNVFTNFNNFPISTTLNLIDTTTYPVRLSVVTACNEPLTGGKYRIKVQSVEGNYEKYFTTSDITGEVIAKLPPLNYEMNVESVENLNAQTQLVVNYLRFRTAALDVYSLAKDTVDKISALKWDSLTHVGFAYHKAPTISVAQGFSNYMCNNPTKAAIVKQGEKYGISFHVQETFNGSACDVQTGYLIVNNAGAENNKDTVLFDAAAHRFAVYNFTAGNPMLVSPFAHLMNIKYYSNSNELLGEKNMALVVEGSAQLPGSDIIVDASENGQVPIPMFVLRDPPGDGSSATLEAGSTVTKTFTVADEGNGHFYLGSDGKVVFTAIGFAWDVEFHIGGGGGRSKSWEITATTTTAISTYDDPAPVHIGEMGDVIVGMGMALQYGLAQQIKVKSCDTIQMTTALGFSPNSVKTQWMYTVGQIQMLIAEYEAKIEEVKAGTLVLRKADGKAYTRAEAVTRLTTYKSNWEKILVYHKRETLPYYALCDKTGQQKAPEPFNSMANEWRNGFCPLVGSYAANGQFLPKDNIVWDQILVEKYNAAATAVRKLTQENISLQTALVWQYDGFSSQNNHVDQQYNLMHGVLAENITFGSGVNYSKTFESATASSQGGSANFSVDLAGWLGLHVEAGGDVIAGTPFAGLGTGLAAVEINAIKIGGGFDYTISQEWEKAKDSMNLISYTLADDDEADQFSVTVIQGPSPNFGPYFSLLGGRSSCPEEVGTIVRDRPDLRLYDPETQSVTTEQSKSEIEPENAATFMLQITNQSLFNEGRDFKLTLKSNTNPNGAIITTMGQNLGYGPVILYGMEPNEPFIVPINVQRGLNGYDYEGLTVAIEPYCGNTAEATDEAILLDSTTNFSVVMNVNFKNPCSDITLVEPDNNWVIQRRNVFDANSREILFAKMMDYDPNNALLLSTRLEYRKLGAGDAWTTISGSVMTKQDLADWNAQNFVASQVPYYPFIWDITDDFTTYSDGDYEIRAVAECGTGGQVYSQYLHGTIARQGQLFGTPQPSDHIWTSGDEISVSYNRDLNCIGIVDSNFVVRSKTQANTFLPGTVSCFNNKLVFTPLLSLKYFDGDTLQMVVGGVRTDNGYLMDTVRWDFLVISKDIRVSPDSIKVELTQGEELNVNAVLAHNSESNNAVNYSFTNLSQYTNWLSSDNASGSIGKSNAANVGFHINTQSMLLGTTTANLHLNNNGLMDSNALVIQVTVLPAAPNWSVNPANFSENMTLLTNFNFDNNNVQSQDTMDMISVWVDNKIRGVANISKFTATNYAALIQVYGDAADANKPLSFRVWDASEGVEYDAKPDNNATISFVTNKLVGNVSSPAMLDIFTASDKARYIPLNQGWTMFSVNSAKWNTPVNTALASLRHPHANDVIKTANKSAAYVSASNSWVSTNGLDSTNVHRGYQIYLQEADTLRITGAPATIKPISLNYGWNFVGYPLQTASPLTSAFTFSTPQPDSIILKTVAQNPNYSQNMVALYQGGSWKYAANSDMSQLRPDFAYKMRVNTQNTKLNYVGANTLQTPVSLLRLGQQNGTPDPESPESWFVNPAEYEHNSLITATVNIDRTESKNADTKVAAFVGDECRGVGELVYVKEINRYVMQMMMYSNVQDEEVEFHIFDADKKRRYTHYEPISFKADSLMGTLSVPYSFRNTPPDASIAGDVYPNPFENRLKVRLNSDKAQSYTLRLTDLMGHTLMEKQISDKTNMTQLTLDTANLDLVEGVYLLQVVGSLGETLTFKVVHSKQ